MYLGTPLVGWDRLDVFGLQLSARQRLPYRFSLGLAPVVNRTKQRFGWLIPVEIGYAPWRWLQAQAGASLGSIANHADLAVPVLYNQPERLLSQVRAGAEYSGLRVQRAGLSFKLSGYVAWERYDNSLQRLFPSLALAVSF
jgi:hypothetical protein